MRHNNFKIKQTLFYKSRLIIALACIFTSATIFASGSASSIQKQNTPRVITDMRGRQVNLPAGAIQRIIALEACSLRLLCYLGVTDKVVAVEDVGHAREKTEHDFFYLASYRIAFPELKNLPSIGSSANHEAIIAAKPDIIICSSVDVSMLDQLQNTLGIPVFAVDADVEFDNIGRFNEQLLKLGALFGKELRAKELVDGIAKALADIARRAQKVSNPKKAYAGGMMFYGPADLLRTSGNYLPFTLTGINNVMPPNPTGNGQPYMTSLETLINANPDFVFIDSANEQLSRKGYIEKKALLDTSAQAFRDKQVFATLAYKYYGTNWENQLINIYFVGKTVYPELYADTNIETKAAEVWRLFFAREISYKAVLTYHKPAFSQVTWW